jgi:hypothetical protein
LWAELKQACSSLRSVRKAAEQCIATLQLLLVQEWQAGGTHHNTQVA